VKGHRTWEAVTTAVNCFRKVGKFYDLGDVNGLNPQFSSVRSYSSQNM